MNSSPPRLFGTDGVRGLANVHPMTAETALRLGQAAGQVLRRPDHRGGVVVIGKDTRLSGYLFESALRAGFNSVGMHCVQVGTIPTPAVAYLTRAFRAEIGVVISASHNPYHDNGIKFFGPNGMKLPDEVERAIEEQFFQDPVIRDLPHPSHIGRAQRIEDARGRYIEFCKNTFPRDLRLTGLKVVVDCANGAAYRVAPEVLWELGAEDVIPLGVKPDGLNINQNCGSLYPELMRDKVRETGADIGLALDGDADRLLVCDDRGRLLDGDQMMALSAIMMKENNTLKGDAVVGTVMSNLGLERFLHSLDLKLLRANVGDRYVLETMLAEGCNLGGEQSGHMIFLDYNTTGDGIVSALKILERMVTQQRPLSELAAQLHTVPQILKNVTIPRGSNPLADPTVQTAIEAAHATLQGQGRLLVRPSGTEPKIRVMAEGDSHEIIAACVDDLCQRIQKAAQASGE
ncbi:Phosphoglucosamine mutase [Candidatus Magnetaquicoccaceae bacterium FCR-1]|uniref:Phosphoglucosamine mutase n=1 Tax=Candidatus Magnetaquiglobus chichijimensis TaxID=3141448 RepID=A0ABQ0C4C3_9PROT